MNKRELLEFIKKHEDEIVYDNIDNVIYKRVGDLDIIITIQGEYHFFNVYRGNKFLCGVDTQSGGAHIWNNMKVFTLENEGLKLVKPWSSK